MKKIEKNDAKMESTKVAVNEVKNTADRPRPEIVIFSDKVKFQSLDGTKWATFPYLLDGKYRVIKCKDVQDLETLKGFKVGPYKYDIPQCNVVLEFTATWNEIAEDGQRFSGSHTYFDAVATFADGKTQKFNGDTGDTIRKAVGLPVSGTKKSPLGVAYRYFSKAEVKGYIDACNNTEVKKAYDQLRGLLGILRDEEAKREAEEKAQKEAAAKEAKKAETAAKHLPNAADLALAEEFARRANITVEQALKMLRH